MGAHKDAECEATFHCAPRYVRSVLLNCGVGVQSDGTIGGFSEACGAASAGLAALGVDVELWLGETDSTAGMRICLRRRLKQKCARRSDQTAQLARDQL